MRRAAANTPTTDHQPDDYVFGRVQALSGLCYPPKATALTNGTTLPQLVQGGSLRRLAVGPRDCRYGDRVAAFSASGQRASVPGVPARRARDRRCAVALGRRLRDDRAGHSRPLRRDAGADEQPRRETGRQRISRLGRRRNPPDRTRDNLSKTAVSRKKVRGRLSGSAPFCCHRSSCLCDGGHGAQIRIALSPRLTQ